MKAAAIICSGPSVALWNPTYARAYDMVITVNRGIRHAGVQPDIVALGDILSCLPATQQASLGATCSSINPRVGWIVNHRDITAVRPVVGTTCDWWPMPFTHRRFCFPATLSWLLWICKPVRVDIYGADLDGDKYADGASIGEPDEARWIMERHAFCRERDRVAPKTTIVRVGHTSLNSDICAADYSAIKGRVER